MTEPEHVFTDDFTPIDVLKLTPEQQAELDAIPPEFWTAFKSGDYWSGLEDKGI